MYLFILSCTQEIKPAALLCLLGIVHRADSGFWGPGSAHGQAAAPEGGIWLSRAHSGTGFLPRSGVSFCSRGDDLRLLVWYFLIHLLKMGGPVSEGLRAEPCPGDPIALGSGFCGKPRGCSISPLAVPAPVNFIWPGPVERNSKAATGTQQPSRRGSGAGMRSRGTILGRARLQAPA